MEKHLMGSLIKQRPCVEAKEEIYSLLPIDRRCSATSQGSRASVCAVVAPKYRLFCE